MQTTVTVMSTGSVMLASRSSSQVITKDVPLKAGRGHRLPMKFILLDTSKRKICRSFYSSNSNFTVIRNIHHHFMYNSCHHH